MSGRILVKYYKQMNSRFDAGSRMVKIQKELIKKGRTPHCEGSSLPGRCCASQGESACRFSLPSRPGLCWHQPATRPLRSSTGRRWTLRQRPPRDIHGRQAAARARHQRLLTISASPTSGGPWVWRAGPRPGEKGTGIAGSFS